MCYFLHLATPLTLSEVRSMLPPGMTAEPAGMESRWLKQLFPAGSTIIRLLVGRCSCDLVRPRLPDALEDERELRGRYGRSKVPRAEIIKALERHRRARLPRISPPSGWPQALSGFVAEHARNAGDTLYYLEFDTGKTSPPSPGKIRQVRSDSVTAVVSEWLPESSPTLVTR